MSHRYAINLFWSEEDNCWISIAPDLDPCSAHGDTPDEAIAELQIAIELVLEVKKEDGDPIPKPKYNPNPFKKKLTPKVR
jgi:predicted RNase H-like HicB family nuclease